MPPPTDDAAVFAGIFDEHRQAVHAYLVGRVADTELARDLIQETFLRVWRRLPEVRALPAERQRAWVFTVARNLTIDTYRAHAARDTAYEAVRHDGPVSRVAEPHVQAELGERVGQLGKAIRRLPEEQRVILSMSAIGGLTSRQIGRALGEPAGTVRYKLSQARKQLAAALDLEE